MVRKGILVIPLALVFALGIIALKASQSPPSVSQTPTPLMAQSPTAIVSPAASSNIEIMTPKDRDMVSSPISVLGNARVFENVVSIRLIDDNGNVLASENVNANSPDVGKFGPFEASIAFNPPQTKSGLLEVYQMSAKDGSEIDKVSIPVIFK